jgi:hypothetical protein
LGKPKALAAESSPCETLLELDFAANLSETAFAGIAAAANPLQF